MTKQIDYVVVQDKLIKNLVLEVARRQQEGWKVTGGLSVVGENVCQAMYKEASD